MVSRTPKHMPKCSAVRTCMADSSLGRQRVGGCGGRPLLNRPSVLRFNRPQAGPPRPALLDDRFQVIEVAAEGLPAGPRELAARLRPAADELLVDEDVAPLFQLLQVDAEVAVGHARGRRAAR